jgi:hypothetical protein
VVQKQRGPACHAVAATAKMLPTLPTLDLSVSPTQASQAHSAHIQALQWEPAHDHPRSATSTCWCTVQLKHLLTTAAVITVMCVAHAMRTHEQAPHPGACNTRVPLVKRAPQAAVLHIPAHLLTALTTAPTGVGNSGHLQIPAILRTLIMMIMCLHGTRFFSEHSSPHAPQTSEAGHAKQYCARLKRTAPTQWHCHSPQVVASPTNNTKTFEKRKTSDSTPHLPTHGRACRTTSETVTAGQLHTCCTLCSGSRTAKQQQLLSHDSFAEPCVWDACVLGTLQT